MIFGDVKITEKLDLFFIRLYFKFASLFYIYAHCCYIL